MFQALSLQPDVLPDITSNGVWSGTFIVFFTSIVHVLLPLSLMTIAFGRAVLARSSARLGDAQQNPTGALRPGPAVLHGAVEYAPGSDAALRVEITQRGEDRVGKNNVYSHVWSEEVRTLVAQPFYVIDPRGRVRVEPDERAILVDELDVTKRVSKYVRVRVADLSPGEQVYVIGELRPGMDPLAAAGYRETGAALVLHPPRGGRMLASAEPLGERFRRTARSEAKWGLVVLLVTLVIGIVDLGFHMRLQAGRYEIATVVSAIPYSGKNAHCKVAMRAADGVTTLHDDAKYGQCAQLTRGTRVRVIRVEDMPRFTQLGDEPGVSISSLVAGSFVLLMLVLFYWMRARPWYESRLVEHGKGRLPD